jgi:hypothetical protein
MFRESPKESTMKKLSYLSVVLLAAFLLIQAGCGGDDGPNDPQDQDCSITVTGPAGGAEYQSGELVRIRWDKQGSASEVSIDLLKGGDLVANIGTFNNDEYQSWDASTMGAVSGDDFQIRVTAVGESGCGDTGDEFTIINTEGCEFSLDSPDTNWLDAGDSFEITWDSNSTTGFVDIELLRGDLPSNEPVGYIVSNTADDGSYEWTVDSLNEGTYAFFYLRISDHGIPSCNAVTEEFGIVDEDICEIWVNAPQPGTTWTVGDTGTITFTAPDMETERVNISLYEGVNYVNTIQANLEVTGVEQSIQWVVDTTGTQSPSTSYRIKISDARPNSYCEGWSEVITILEN